MTTNPEPTPDGVAPADPALPADKTLPGDGGVVTPEGGPFKTNGDEPAAR
jgi:hypothetical protein